MRMKRLAHLAITTAAVGAVAAGCGSSSSSSGGDSGDGPIVVGMSASETGPYAVDGILSLKGVQYGVQAVNESGGWLGRKVELKVIDDQSDPTKAQQAYQKLITQDQVDFIIGPYAPDLAAAAGAVATRYKYVMLDPETACDHRGQQVGDPGRAERQPEHGWVPVGRRQAGYHTSRSLASTTPTGDACAKGIKQEAQEAGVKVVYTSRIRRTTT